MNINDIGSNLTGGQIATVLDKLLFDSLKPIVMKTNFMDDIVPKIFINIIRDRRRKISALSYEDSCMSMIKCISSGNKKSFFNHITCLKVERNIWSKVINDFLSKKDDYKSLFCNPFTKSTWDKKVKIEKELGCEDLWSVFCDVEYFFEQYSIFRGKIINQYIQQSHKYAHGIGCDQVSHQDLHQMLILAVSKGLDKYDSSSGALSSYILFWQSNVRSSMFDSFTNNSVAFDVPNSFKRKIAGKECPGNWSCPIVVEQDNYVDGVQETLTRDRLLTIIRLGDINGIYSLSNNIENSCCGR